MGYALIPGDLYDFDLTYKNLPEIRAITDHEALSAPSWVRDQLIDVWTSYNGDNKVTGASFGQLFERMWFGVVTMVVFGYYECTYSYPGDDEQWEKHLSTLPAEQHLLDHFKRRGVNPADYIIRTNGNEFIMRNSWKPSVQRAAIREVMEASGNAERLKPAVYSHMGTMGLDREIPFVKEHPELLVTRANGEPYRHATDYNLVRERPVGLLLQGGSPIVQDWWVRTLERQFEFFEPKITYFDTLFRSAVMVDWKNHVATQGHELYPMYRGFIETAHGHDAALFTNYAMPMLSDMSYSEDAAYTNYRGNWRSYAARMAGQQALNRPGRPLIVVNTPRSLPLGFPPETRSDSATGPCPGTEPTTNCETEPIQTPTSALGGGRRRPISKHTATNSTANQALSLL